MAKYRLTESRLRGMIREAVKTALNEMPLVNMKTKERHSHDLSSWAPTGKDWKWKYGGDRIDKRMWHMKKSAEKEQLEIDTKNKYSAMVRNGELTLDDLGKYLRGEIDLNIPPEDIKNMGGKWALSTFGVIEGRHLEDVMGKNGWPTAKYVNQYLRDHFNYVDDWTEIGVEPNFDTGDVSPEDIYRALDYAMYRNDIGYEDSHWRR